MEALAPRSNPVKCGYSLESRPISAAAVATHDGGQTHVRKWYLLSAEFARRLQIKISNSTGQLQIFSCYHVTNHNFWNTFGEVLCKDMDWRKLNKVSFVRDKSLLNQVPVKGWSHGGREESGENLCPRSYYDATHCFKL
ncbi:hypothetical protein ACH5RR_024481 [Cinchona calisaya]|uniref:Uncharacterized protein n=1 Tax=Cinchona calisaya TaxID=153742 RepID=A0ABD2YZJ3_9GENT